MKLREILNPVEYAKSFVGDGLPEGPDSFPHLGLRTVERFQHRPIQYGMKYLRNYGNGKMFTLRAIGFKLLVVAGAEANQHILVENADNFSWGEGLYNNFVPFLGRGLLTTDGHTHDRARKLMEPAFRHSQLREYTGAMVEETKRALNEINEDEPFDLYRWMREVAISIASRTLLGIDPRGSMAKELAQAFETGLSFYKAPIYTYPFIHKVPNRLPRSRKKILNIIGGEIENRSRDGENPDNVLDSLLQTEVDGEQLSREEIKDQVLTLLFAGHDTTAATVGWAMSLLGKNKTEYDRLEKELDEELDGKAPNTDQIMEGFDHLNAVIDETLRLYPAAWIGPRKAKGDFTINGQTIPAGTQLLYSSLLTHRMEEYYDDPASFAPDRFKQEGYKRNLPPGSYIPFGRGKRTCIGMNFGTIEIRTILSILFQEYRLTLVPGQDYRPRTMPTLSPANGVYVRAKHRNDKNSMISAPRKSADKTKKSNNDDSSGCPFH